jgi:hypothetical protein
MTMTRNPLLIDEPVQTRVHYEEDGDRLIIQRIQDVEPILEANKAKANDARTDWKGEFHHVASIPLVIIEKYKNEKGIDLMKDKAAMKRFLNDPDNKFLRVKPGKI